MGIRTESEPLSVAVVPAAAFSQWTPKHGAEMAAKHCSQPTFPLWFPTVECIERYTLQVRVADRKLACGLVQVGLKAHEENVPADIASAPRVRLKSSAGKPGNLLTQTADQVLGFRSATANLFARYEANLTDL